MPTGTSFAFHRSAATFQSAVPPFNLCDAQRIVAETPLNIPNGFYLSIAKPLAKLDAIPLLD